MSTISKLELTLNPTLIQPLTITEENKPEIIDQLRLFSERLYEMRTMIGKSKQSSKWDYDSYSMWHFMHELIKGMPFDQAWTELRMSINGPLWDSLRNSLRNYMWDSLSVIQRVSSYSLMCASIRDSIQDSLWASVCGNLSEQEYNVLFRDKELLEKLPYDKVKELSDLFNWFSARGIFPHRGIKRTEYLIVPWSNPKNIQPINI